MEVLGSRAKVGVLYCDLAVTRGQPWKTASDSMLFKADSLRLPKVLRASSPGILGQSDGRRGKTQAPYFIPGICFLAEDLGQKDGSRQSLFCASLALWVQGLKPSVAGKEQFSKVASGYGTCL